MMFNQYLSKFRVDRRLSSFLLAGLFLLSVSIAPVRSQQSLNLELIQNLYQLGSSYRACESLLEGLAVNTKLCEPEKRWTPENLKELENAFQYQLQPKKIAAYHLLGNVMRVIGKLKESEYFLKEGLKIQTLSTEEKAIFHLSLGNTLKASGDVIKDRVAPPKYDDYVPWECKQISMPDSGSKEYAEIEDKYNDAVRSYQEVQKLAKSGQFQDEKRATLTHMKAWINLVDLQTQRGQIIDLPDVNALDVLSGETKIYTQISTIKKLSCKLQKNNQPLNIVLSQLIAISTQELTLPETKRKRVKSYALGSLGGFYEYLAEGNNFNYLTTQNSREVLLAQAKRSTDNALYLAQSSNSADMTYQWQWQLGRLYKKQGNREQAISSYTQAIETLKKVRRNLIAVKSDVQFSFRDNTIPLYRELVSLLLKVSSENQMFSSATKENIVPSRKNNSNETNNIQKAIEVIDDLQLADLENFLRCDLSQVVKLNRDSDEYAKDTALIYPIFLGDKFKVLYKLPENAWKQKEFSVSPSVVEKLATSFRVSILNRDSQEKFIQSSKQLYDWLIRPVEDQLSRERKTVKTLAFVLDGELRNIPLAALFDGQDYLIKKPYSLAILPGAQLFDLSPLNSQKINILAAVVTQEFPVLEGLSFERIEAKEILDGNKIRYSKLLRNEEFTQKNLREAIQSGKFSIVHITTHGSFSSDPEKTYLLAFDKDSNQKPVGTLLRAGDFSNSLKVRRSSDSRPIKLLVLSACETAQGDSRATLGLAGFAIRSGANSTLSTLWRVGYESTQVLMESFYENLRSSPNITKSEALHLAQKKLADNTDFQDPYNWAGYILIGNWL